MKVCAACDSTTTYINKKGVACWHYHNEDLFCDKCFKYYIWNPAFNPVFHVRRFGFQGLRYFYKNNPRLGVCSKCGARVGIECKRTSLHHLEYDPDNPLNHTIELCNSCHRQTHWNIIHVASGTSS